MRRAASETVRASARAAILSVIVVSPGAGADALGDARLFFTPAERGSSSRERTERDPAASTSTAGAPTGTATDRSGSERSAPTSAERAASAGRAGGQTGAGAGTGASPGARSGGGFEAVLRIGERVRVIVGGRSCRGDRGTRRLRCGALPDGVRSLELEPDGRRLAVTFGDGRSARVGLGEALGR